ncbi:MAG: hypothetical protein AB7O97_07160 [Planctomycetota bacterium]
MHDFSKFSSLPLAVCLGVLSSCGGGGGSPPPANIPTPTTGVAALAGSWVATSMTFNGADVVALGTSVTMTFDLVEGVAGSTWLVSIQNDTSGLCEGLVSCAPSGPLRVDGDTQFVFDPDTADEIVWTYTAIDDQLTIGGVANGGPIAATLARTDAPEPPPLLAHENFDYAEGIGTMPDSNGGIGWAAPWALGASFNNPGDVLAQSLVPLGASAALQTSGGATMAASFGRDGRFLDVSPTGPFGANGYLDAEGNIGADDTTIYLSFLQQTSHPEAFWEFEWKRDSLDDDGRIAGIGNDIGGTDVNLRAPAGQANVHTRIGPADTLVNFWVVRIDFRAGDDSIRVYRNPPLVVEPAVADLDLVAQSDLSFDGISFGSFGGEIRVSHDEVRIGSSYAAVTPR